VKMAMKFHPLRVEKIVRETGDAITIYFHNPDRSVYNYIPGQYLTLKVLIDGKPYNRAFSLCSCPVDDDQLAVTVKVTPGGKVSTHLYKNLKEGDTIDVMPPLGNFVAQINPSNRNHYVLIGAGSGITPLMSILRTALAKEPHSKVTLLYGNRSEGTIIFREALTRLRAGNPDRLTVIHTLSQPSEFWEGLKGRISDQLVLEVHETVKNTRLQPEYYVCGPSAMMDTTLRALKDLGLSKEHVHEEHFTAPLTHPMDEGESVAVSNEEQKIGTYDVKIFLDDQEHTLRVYAGQSVLDAALDADLDPPYACMIGSCCTCKGKLLSGNVTMDDREGLTDSEIRDGYILTCQSHPVTPDVVISYDQV
ncbi:MAG: ferredoxin--NADP reductase, partial [Bacteroidota bacterium]|nr:ferredoxin--NADP reductase [Bacteroidota bacterium]